MATPASGRRIDFPDKNPKPTSQIKTRFKFAFFFCAIVATAIAAPEENDGLANKAELYEGKEFQKAFANPKDNPELPNVLLIGDSISIGYTVEVRKLLKGEADVFRIPENGKDSAYGLEHLDKWLGSREWDVIHFNWGLWDLCYRNPESKNQGHRDKVEGTLTATTEQYRDNLEKIVARLKKTEATLIWCATTPVPKAELGRKTDDDLRYNRVAEDVMRSNGIAINDLHTYALQKLPGIRNGKGDVHFTKAGYAYLAGKVSRDITDAGAEPIPFELDPEKVTAMVASRASIRGGARRHFRSGNVIHRFESPGDTVTWKVIAPADGDYVVGVLFSGKKQSMLEVSSGGSVVKAPSLVPTWEGRPYFWRQELPGSLSLKKGENEIVFRLPDAKPITSGNDNNPRFGQGKTEEFHLFSLELGTADARKGVIERAREIRGDTSWMVEGKYGLFVHWSAQSHPLHGDRRRADWFQKSVEIFDVEVFADAVERTGAAWVTFTAAHQGFYWPAPSAAIDRIAKGRTSERDLLGEIIDALDSRGIRTLFYLHTGYNGYDPEEWREAAGANEIGSTRFSDNIEDILRECSLRYGEKLKGFGYIDGALAWDYPLNPDWEGWARAIKAGNPEAVVGFSTNRGPAVTPFSELGVTDSASKLSEFDPRLFGSGKQFGDVLPAWWCLMDKEGWFPSKPLNGKISSGPVHSTEEYVSFFKRMSEKGIPVTINLIMPADVTDGHPVFSPKCMAVMEDVRKEIRGK